LHEHSEEIPTAYKETEEEEDIHRWVTDFVSGMTDRFAMNFFKERYLPQIYQA